MLSGLGFRRLSCSKTLPLFFFQIVRSVSGNPASYTSSEIQTLILRQYSNGKFRDLFRAAISEPSFLLAACRNLCDEEVPLSSDSINRLICIEDLAFDLRSGRMDAESSCVKLLPSRKKGPHLVLPNLKLKVVMEAVRMALEIVYEKRIATFAYAGGRGGRAGMGRHTAVRYLKAALENPNWWFCVSLRRQAMDLCRLKAVLAEKIDDDILIGFIERLFESKAVAIELGGLDLGRGFPQESSLNSILVNIYFNGLDKEIQEIRAQVHRTNPKLKNLDREEDSRVFHKPVRVYAVRYLDEVLIATSGSKLLMIDIKDRILKYVQSQMSLTVDKLKASIHSAVSEKMDFMGMEIQAVSPLVLHPPLSEKAMRAKKKHLKQKAAKVLELKNARETTRKKLGLKILKHVFKKLKHVGGFKIDMHVESEVRELFRMWAEEVVVEYLNSKEECYHWHKMLTSGDFLSLKRVRDQLPESLVVAYDQFQEKLNEHFMPKRTSKQLEENEMEEQDEEKRYAKRTVEDLVQSYVRVNAPMELVRRAIKLAGFTNSMGRPRPIKLLICLDDSDIIKWYAGVARRWLDFYCCCRNFKMVKTVVSYHLRFSCLLTLAEKHDSTKKQAIQHYTKDLKIIDEDGVEKMHFSTEKEIRMLGERKLSDPKPVDGAITMALVRLAFNEDSSVCLAHFCESENTVIYRVRLLQNRLNVDPLNEEKWVHGMGAIHEALNKKCLPLCSKHATDLFLGKISLQDIDCTLFLNLD
ncbi:LOW QUALITY PROTEIN: uncharacterized protein LOC110022337 [Phalaenopsis equestris]|uniref:LOW QUALITY PROTEIN: uncharacterized protein LOC110022337 n=1 Tax=Phalaenopsis equestris TaxID=78828 RepID=UPI0009E3E696|nr:LOW QUALITY PROTEIN: uncharacterized protein LOC110022337 [Phalaenopsis equestris]